MLPSLLSNWFLSGCPAGSWWNTSKGTRLPIGSVLWVCFHRIPLDGGLIFLRYLMLRMALATSTLTVSFTEILKGFVKFQDHPSNVLIPALAKCSHR